MQQSTGRGAPRRGCVLRSWAVVVGLVVGASPVLPPTPAGAAPTIGAVYRGVTPTRLADTRLGLGTTPTGRPAAGEVRRVRITGRSEVTVPGDATAVVLNVTAVGAAGAGYVSVYPGDSAPPNASNLNLAGIGYTGANLVTVRLGAGGTVDLFTSVATDLLVDIAGYYAPATGAVTAGRTVPAGPTRLHDTRTTGTPLGAGELRTIGLPGVPAGARAVVLNATVTDAAGPGFWSIVPPDARLDPTGAPTTSSLNVAAAGATVAGQVIVPIGDDRRIAAFSSAGGHLILDLSGYVTGPTGAASTDGLFVALDGPLRMLDTRTGNSALGTGHRMWPGWVTEVPIGGRGGVPGSGVSAIVGNLTSVDPHGWGWAATYAAGTPFPGTSSVNTDTEGAIVPNHVLSPVSARGVAVLASAGGHVLLDVAGYLTGTPAPAREPVPVNAVPLPAYPLRMEIPAIGVDAALQGDSQEADLVHGPGWWPGTAYLGVDGNMAVFGHRTDHGGIFRGVNRLRAGDRITISGDRRTAVYEVKEWVVVPADRAEDYIGPSGGPMLTIIACSRPDGSASSLAHRIIVTATRVSYTDA